MENKYKRFLSLKTEIKVNKTIYNSFGKFYYRNKESIQEALKPLELKHNLIIMVDDDCIENVNGKLFVVAKAYVIDVETGETFMTSTSRAELQGKSGTQMNESQLTGSASSYAGKYALQNLLGIDDNKDGDDEVHNQKTTTQPKPPTQQVVQPKTTVQPTQELPIAPVAKAEVKNELTDKDILKSMVNVKTIEDLNELWAKAQSINITDGTKNLFNFKATNLKAKLINNKWEVQ